MPRMLSKKVALSLFFGAGLKTGLKYRLLKFSSVTGIPLPLQRVAGFSSEVNHKIFEGVALDSDLRGWPA